MRLNVEDLEGRALMSVTLAGAISAPTLDAAVVRGAEGAQTTSESNLLINLTDVLVSSFKASDTLLQTYPSVEYDVAPR